MAAHSAWRKLRSGWDAIGVAEDHVGRGKFLLGTAGLLGGAFIVAQRWFGLVTAVLLAVCLAAAVIGTALILTGARRTLAREADERLAQREATARQDVTTRTLHKAEERHQRELADLRASYEARVGTFIPPGHAAIITGPPVNGEWVPPGFAVIHDPGMVVDPATGTSATGPSSRAYNAPGGTALGGGTVGVRPY